MRVRHGRSTTPTYSTWEAMKQRCLNPRNMFYQDYGGRGIKICDRWLTYLLFEQDMGNRPQGMTLDRIDNYGNYCPENCRWATEHAQHRNTRSNRYIEFNGRTMCLTDWSNELSIPVPTLRKRLRNWDVTRALTEPINVSYRTNVTKSNTEKEGRKLL